MDVLLFSEDGQRVGLVGAHEIQHLFLGIGPFAALQRFDAVEADAFFPRHFVRPERAVFDVRLEECLAEQARAFDRDALSVEREAVADHGHRDAQHEVLPVLRGGWCKLGPVELSEFPVQGQEVRVLGARGAEERRQERLLRHVPRERDYQIHGQDARFEPVGMVGADPEARLRVMDHEGVVQRGSFFLLETIFCILP